MNSFSPSGNKFRVITCCDLLLPFLILLCMNNLQAQQQIFFEDFSSGIPIGWVITDNSNSGIQWEWDTIPASTGNFPETFNHPGATNGHVRVDSDSELGTGPENTDLITPAFDFSTYPYVFLEFEEYFRKYQSDAGRVFVSNDSVNWNLVWVSSAGLAVNQGTANPQEVRVNITQYAGGNSTVYVKWNYEAEKDYYWFLDDVTFTTPDNYDLALISINTNFTGCNLSANEPVEFEFFNNGATPIDSFTARYRINNGPFITDTVRLTTPLFFGDTARYTFSTPYDLSAGGNYSIFGSVSLPLDNNVSNNALTIAAVSVEPVNVTLSAYSSGFETGPFNWVIEDANQDNFSWYLSTTAPFMGTTNLRYLWNDDATTGGDDWAFTPCLELDSAKAYLLKFWHRVGSNNDGTIFNERLKVMMGPDAASTSMNILIEDLGLLSNDTYEEFTKAFKPSTSGIYHIGLHCYSDPDAFFLNIDDFSVEALPAPQANFSASVLQNRVTVSDLSTNNPDNWSWNWDDGSGSTGKNPAPHTYADTGSYTICLTVANLAGSDSFCQTIHIAELPTAVREFDQLIVKISPNPVNDLLMIGLENFEPLKNVTVVVYNILGERIFQTRATGKNMVIDFADFSEGMYLVRVDTDQGGDISRIIFKK